MKQKIAADATLESMVESYTFNRKERNVVFTIKPDQRMDLIRIGFNGDEEIMRVTKNTNVNEIEFRIWYESETSYSWTVGSSRTIVGAVRDEQGKKMQQLAEKATGKSFAPYTKWE